jgi:hypothetical protein
MKRYLMLRKAFILMLLVFAVGCGAKKAAIEDVEKAGELFFQQLDAANYDAIYKSASEEFKKMRTREETVADLKQIAEFGKIHSHALTQAPILADGKIVQPTYKVLLDLTRGSIELSFIDERGEWKLHGFLFKKAG